MKREPGSAFCHWGSPPNWRPLALSFIVGGGLGGMIGAWLASRLSQKKDTLNLLSAVVIGLTAVYMLYRSATG